MLNHRTRLRSRGNTQAQHRRGRKAAPGTQRLLGIMLFYRAALPLSRKTLTYTQWRLACLGLELVSGVLLSGVAGPVHDRWS